MIKEDIKFHGIILFMLGIPFISMMAKLYYISGIYGLSFGLGGSVILGVYVFCYIKSREAFKKYVFG